MTFDQFSNDLFYLWPEIFLALAGFALLLYSAFTDNRRSKFVFTGTIISFILAGLLLASRAGDGTPLLNGLWIEDTLSWVTDLLILAAGAIGLMIALPWIKQDGLDKGEFAILTLFAVIGCMTMVSANHFMTLYIGIELQSLCFYTLLAFQRQNIRASEASLKYFILSAIASGISLYGISLIYGATGDLTFGAVADAIAGGMTSYPLLMAGLIGVVVGLVFKLSLVPFHMWTPDVYQGGPLPVVLLMASLPKMAAAVLLYRVLFGVFGDLTGFWQPMVIFLAAGSVILGGFAAIPQQNIKRLIGYSTIGQLGYVMIGLAAASEFGATAGYFYLLVYIISTIGLFAVLNGLRQDGFVIDRIDDLSGLAQLSPARAFQLSAILFSLTGIPPLAGFLSKFLVFFAAVSAGLITLTIIGVLASVVAAFYYLKIIRVMYTGDPLLELDHQQSGLIAVIGWVSVILLLGMIIRPGPFLTLADYAVSPLF
jgi:NADH-quinone oxidoreductase subunit N